MSVVIKTMMNPPPCCGWCRFCKGGCAEAVYCSVVDRYIADNIAPYDKRMEWCPLGEPAAFYTESLPECCDKCGYKSFCIPYDTQLKKMQESESAQIFDVFGEMRLNDCPLKERSK